MSLASSTLRTHEGSNAMSTKRKDLPALGPPLHDPEVHFINGAKWSPDTSYDMKSAHGHIRTCAEYQT